jgi:hypothetical protein
MGDEDCDARHWDLGRSDGSLPVCGFQVRRVVAGGALGLGPDGAASPALCFPTEPNFRSD